MLERQVLRLFFIRFHRMQNGLVVQNQPLAAQVLPPLVVGMRGVFPGFEFDHIAPARDIEHAGRLHGLPSLLLIRFQCEQIQQHLQILSVEQFCIVKILVAGFVINDAEIACSVCLIDVYAVNLTGQQAGAAFCAVFDRRQRAAGGKAQFLCRRCELRQAQFPRHVHHDGGSLLPVAGRKIAFAARSGFSLWEICAHAGIHTALCQRRNFPVRHGREAAVLLRRSYNVFEHVMHERAEQGCVEFCLLPWRGAQAVLQEERIAAACKTVDLRGGERDGPAVERAYRFRPHGGEGICAALRECPCFQQHCLRQPVRQRDLLQGSACGCGAVWEEGKIFRRNRLQRRE